MPPRVALWLVDLCAPPDQSETVLGDLSEEFSSMATNHGAAAARRWYWRQAMKTSAHLLGGQVAQAPWFFLAVALIGWYVPRVCGVAINKGVSVIHARWQVYSYFDPYLFWLLYGVLVRSTIVPMFTGWLVATVSRHRPIVAALILAASGALANLIPLSLGTLRAMPYWPTHPFLARIDQNHFVEMSSLTALHFVAVLAGAVLARKHPFFGIRQTAN